MRTTVKHVNSNLEWLNSTLREQGLGLQYELEHSSGGYRLRHSGTMRYESARMGATEMYYTLEAMSNMLRFMQPTK